MDAMSLLLACVTASVLLLSVGFAEGQQTLQIGSRRELFVDRHLITRLDGVDLKLHTPESRGATFTFDRPWEGRYSCGYSVFKDGDIYRMYYRGMSTEAAQRTCYAESRDGIEWTRPNLGLCEFEGDELVLNYSTSAAGSIRVELQDEAGKPIDRFALGKSKLLIGDEIDGPMSWEHGGSAAELQGKPIRLRFVMRDADLYSFRFK